MDFTDQIKRFAEGLSRVYQEEGRTIVFVPTEKEDFKLGKELEKLMPEVDFIVAPAEWNLLKISALIENSHMLIGMRMHSVIMAARQKVPFLALIYDGKVRELLKMMDLERVGMPIENMEGSVISGYIKYIEENYTDIQTKLDEISRRFRKDVIASAEIVKAGTHI